MFCIFSGTIKASPLLKFPMLFDMLQGFELSIYDPNMSSTSKKVTCSSSLCAQHSTCLDGSSHCPYSISYISSETSTSGILMDDVLHLKTEDSHQESIEAYVTFGLVSDFKFLLLYEYLLIHFDEMLSLLQELVLLSICFLIDD